MSAGRAVRSHIALPDDWRIGTLGDVVQSVRGGFSVNCEDRPAKSHEVGVLKTGAVLSGHFIVGENKLVRPEEHGRVRTPVRRGTIIFCRKNSDEVVGAAALAREDHHNIYLSDLLWQILPKEEVCVQWLLYVLQSDVIRQEIRRAATGTQSSMKNISQDRLLGIEIVIPPYRQQRNIAEAVKTWDSAILTLEALRDANLRRSTWLRANLLRGEVRLPGFCGAWKEVRLSDVLTESELTSTGNEPVYSVSVHKGLVNQVEHLGRSFAAAKTEHYNRVQFADIVYTKSPTGDFPLGIVKQSSAENDVIVSPLYGVFTPKSPAVGTILDAYFESPISAGNYLRPLVQKGAKNTIAIKNSRFLEGRLNLPMDEDERAAIAQVIQTSRDELHRLESEIEVIARQKRGLMQKLLTGEWHVKSNVEKEHAR